MVNQPVEQATTGPKVDTGAAVARAAEAREAAMRAASAGRDALKANRAGRPSNPIATQSATQPVAQPAPKPAAPSPAPDPKLAEARSALPTLMTQLRSIAESESRTDLVERLDNTRRRSADSSVRTAVVGLRRKGKSHLINAMLSTDVCAVGDRRSTSVITVVRHAEPPTAKLLVAQPGTTDPYPMPLPMEELNSDLATSRFADGHEVMRAEIGITNSILAGNLALVDTPGVGGRGQPHAVRVLNEVATSDATVFVTDASQEFTQPELRFLSQVLDICPTICVAMTKTDIYPEWRRILEANQRHLERNDLDCKIFPASALLREHAVRLSDKEVNAESGYPELLRFLRFEVLADSATQRIVRIARDFDSVTELLTIPLQTELNALRDPAFRERVTAELKERKELSDARAKAASSWQQVLSDGIADLTSDVGHDMKNCMRRISKSVDEALSEADPDKKWPDICDSLVDQVNAAVADNFVWAFESAQELAARVAVSFAESGRELDMPTLDAMCSGDLIDPEIQLGGLAKPTATRAQKLLVAVRGGYGGVGMANLATSMATSMVGLATANPIAMGAPLVAGLLLARQATKDDRTNRQAKRRAEALAVARKYIEEVSVQVNKLSQDRLRTVQRTLRDHFKSIAEQELASLQSSMKAAQEATNLEFTEREKKSAQVERKLAILTKCRDSTMRLLAVGAVGG